VNDFSVAVAPQHTTAIYTTHTIPHCLCHASTSIPALPLCNLLLFLPSDAEVPPLHTAPLFHSFSFTVTTCTSFYLPLFIWRCHLFWAACRCTLPGWVDLRLTCHFPCLPLYASATLPHTSFAIHLSFPLTLCTHLTIATFLCLFHFSPAPLGRCAWHRSHHLRCPPATTTTTTATWTGLHPHHSTGCITVIDTILLVWTRVHGSGVGSTAPPPGPPPACTTTYLLFFWVHGFGSYHMPTFRLTVLPAWFCSVAAAACLTTAPYLPPLHGCGCRTWVGLQFLVPAASATTTATATIPPPACHHHALPHCHTQPLTHLPNTCTLPFGLAAVLVHCLPSSPRTPAL